MSRIIKFRGITPIGEWRYGSLVIEPDGTHKIAEAHRDILLYYGVIPETVGQFIGPITPNGTEIFQGDKVLFHYFYSSFGESLGVSESEHSLAGIISMGRYGWAVEAITGEHWQGYTGYEAGDAECSIMNEGSTDNKNANIAARNAWDIEKQRITDAENNRVKDLYEKNKAHNQELEKAHDTACDEIDAEVRLFNRQQDESRTECEMAEKARSILEDVGFNICALHDWINELKGTIQDDKQPEYPTLPIYLQEKFEPEYKFPEEPEYIQEMPDDAKLKEIDDQIFQAVQINQQAQRYKDYVDYKQSVDIAKDEADAANEAVKVIEAERTKLIQSAKFPAGIDITPDGITIDGLPLDRNQISTSKLYMAAIRIASMNLGDVKTLYFDASFLDRASLDEIQAWAENNDLQLLIEHPSWEEQELHYEIVEQHGPTPTQSLSKDLFDKAA